MSLPDASLPPARFSAQNRSRALQADIMELILDRDLKAGDALPTEGELTLALGIGRNTLREALKVLQALGVIEIRHGFGMFVAPANFDALADGLTFRGRLSLRHEGKEALQLVDVRQALESGLIGEAMDLSTPDHLAEIEATVQQMETLAAEGEVFTEVDEAFHYQLFEPLGNELLSNLMSVFWKVYRKIHAELGGDPLINLTETAAVHRGIFEAVKDGDKELAAERLRRHFDGIRGELAKLQDAS
ncbi:FadR family transcriptional regulator [Arthrobacter zhaoxinii]|uniref:FadR family transcriptional regulator n=1 Tax=Arthrobacter zhaoxinii TaxID=2964616 RepID=A0ABY5YTR5_9MICC|nr:FadR/GntR family transcriptional regulator [Arthrobacter zhaoxinii]MCQ2002169.1 FadR family transcriptional regulator [Arthrobacter zhaoxinii]UWX97414.1 FadR family transcriptional regulator [Arthrobacter zhaoxinii]